MTSSDEVIEAPEVDSPQQEPVSQPDPPSKKLYNKLNAGHLYTKSYDEFQKQFSTPEAVEKLHSKLNAGGYYTKTKDDFQNQFFPVTKQPAKATTPTQLGGNMSVEQITGFQPMQDADFARAQDEARTKHANQYLDAVKTKDNVLKNIGSTAKNVLTQEEMRRRQNQMNDYTSGNSKEAPPILQSPIDIPQEWVDNLAKDPTQETNLLLAKKQELKKDGKTADANKIDKALYVFHSLDRATGAAKQNQIADNADKIQSGEIKYDPKSGQLIKPEGIGESITTSSKNRDLDYELNDLSANDPKTAIARLNDWMAHEGDPDNAKGVPKNALASIAGMAGDQGQVMGKMAASQLLNVVPVIGTAAAESLSAGFMANEMAVRAFGGELKRSYAYNKQQGLSDEDAFKKAKEDANVGMYNAMPAGFVFGAMGAGAAAKEAGVFKDIAKSTTDGWTNRVIRNGFKSLGEQIPKAIATGATAGAQTAATNIMVNQKGRGAMDDVGTAFKDMAIFHLAAHSLTSIAASGAKLTGKLYDQTLQGLSKFPTDYIQNVMNEQIQNGSIKPIDAAKVLKDLEEHKLLDEQIPKSIKNQDIRLDLMNWVEKRNALEEEAKKANVAFKEPLKLKIEKIDEKINEVVADPKAKEEDVLSNEEKEKLAHPIQKALDEGILRGGNAMMAEHALKSPEATEQFLKDVSDQALNKIASNATDPEISMKAAIENYGKEVVDLAIEKYPKEPSKISVIKPEDNKKPNIIDLKTKDNALQESGASSVLQHPQEGVGIEGGERGRMESSQQGNEVTGTQENTTGSNEKEQPQGVSSAEGVTGIKKSITESIRAERNLPKVELPPMGSDVENITAAKERVDSGKSNPRDIINNILADKDKKTGFKNHEEAFDIQYYAHQLEKHSKDLSEELANAKTPEEKATVTGKQQQLSDDIDAYTEASRIAGNNAGKTLSSFAPVIDKTSGQIFREDKAIIKDAYGGEVPKEVQEKLDAITKERDEAIASRLKVEEELRQKMANKGFEEVRKQAKKAAKKAETKEALKKEESDLINALKKAFKKDIGNINSGIPIPKETVEVLGKLAVNYVKQGINTLEGVVDRIYETLKDDAVITRKDIRDILIDYEPLTIATETNRLNKKAELLENKITPTTILTKKGEPAGVNLPTDFAKPSKIQREFRKSNEWVKATQRVANAEHKIKIEKRKAFESKKNFYQKSLMWFGRATRLSVLSGYNVLGKLASAATIGSAAKRIPEQIIGKIYATAFKGISEKAPIEGYINAKSEAKFYTEFFNPKKFAKNAWEILKTGSADLGKRLGGAEYEHIPGLYLPTDLHQIIKDPPKRATFEASLKNSLVWAEKNGLDINDDLVFNSLENAAYKRAQYEIFQEQNWLSKKFTSYKFNLEKKGNTGASVKFLVDFMIPVSTVPTNIARRLVTTSPLGLIRGTKEVISAYRNGIEKLTPEQADHVMMQLKQGTLGTALWLIGWYGYDSFGGLYSKYDPNKKRKAGDFKSDEMMVGGKMLPKPMQHALPLEVIQFAATARRVYNNSTQNLHKSTPSAITNAGFASIGALLEQIPVIETGVHMAEAAGDPYMGEKLKNDVERRFEPQILRETGIIPKDEKKAPETKPSKPAKRNSTKPHKK